MEYGNSVADKWMYLNPDRIMPPPEIWDLAYLVRSSFIRHTSARSASRIKVILHKALKRSSLDLSAPSAYLEAVSSGLRSFPMQSRVVGLVYLVLPLFLLTYRAALVRSSY